MFSSEKGTIMALKVYKLDDFKEWDDIVRSFEHRDVYYLSGYVKGLKIHGDGEPLLFFYEDKNIRGMNVVFKRDISELQEFKGILKESQWFDFITPYGYGGWIIEGSKDASTLLKKYEEWCQKNHIISEFVRFHPVLENHSPVEDFYNIVPLGQTISMDLETPDEIWQNLVGKNRNVIRKAIKSGVKVYSGRSKYVYDNFRTIYDKTMSRDNAESYYYFGDLYYQSLLEDLPFESQVFYAEYEGTIISIAIILSENDLLSYHLSGSLKDFQNLAPSNLLLYHVAKWGNLNGKKTFHLGGGLGSQEDNLFKFKKAFNKEGFNQFYIGKKIHNQYMYDELVEISAKDSNNSFFPLYRS